MSDGISDSYKDTYRYRSLAEKEFGSLTDRELAAELDVAENDYKEAQENYKKALDRKDLLWTESYRRLRLKHNLAP